LLDEPSLGLAPLIVERVLESVLALRDEGVTVVLVEQNAHRAIELADRTYVLRTGQIRMRGTREELVSRAELADLYLGVERT
jgi:branched-chain amino acid transport system ATP-binding protein